jgi:hypothetical protein
LNYKCPPALAKSRFLVPIADAIALSFSQRTPFIAPAHASVILTQRAEFWNSSGEEAAMTAGCKQLRCLLTVAIFLHLFGLAQAAAYRIEPDDYAEDTNLNDILPVVDLRIYNSYAFNFPDQFGVFPDPTVIPITANENEDIFGGYFTSTGIKSFAHSGIGFFTKGAELAMKFSEPASQVTIDFIGRDALDPAVGILQIYSPQGALLDTVTTSPLFDHQTATMSFTRSQSDIGYARAYSSDEADVFGTLDNLRFTIGATALSGDFNGDGVVDAADYVKWRNGLGPTYSPSDYTTWRQNYGSHSGAGAGTVTAVPEPALVALLAVVSVLTSIRRRSK